MYADDAEQARLASLGFELEVLQEDLASFYAQRAAADAALGPGPGSMGGFRTLAEIGQAMDALAASYPAIASPKFSIMSAGKPASTRIAASARAVSTTWDIEPEYAGEPGRGRRWIIPSRLGTALTGTPWLPGSPSRRSRR